MITLFACPKAFLDPHIALIQRNAIVSWVALRPRPTIILFGDEDGIAEVSMEFGLVHVPSVKRNALGTPLLSDVFRKAEAMTSDSVACYVNADIILMDDFIEAVRVCAQQKRRWLMGGRPRDLPLQQPLLCTPGWQDRLKSDVRERGALRWAGACDYFAFSRGLWGELPPFAIGRSYFDNALLYLARTSGAALIDATPSVVAVHQSHGYRTSLAGEGHIKNPEAQENIRLAGGCGKLYTWENATHRIAGGVVEHWWPGILRVWGHYSPRAQTLRNHVWYPILGWTRPIRKVLSPRCVRATNAAGRLKTINSRSAAGER